tara:strand:+ start:801 stop:1025 length:225 start_codon:yes stop_codon:yes gene_type:complete
MEPLLLLWFEHYEAAWTNFFFEKMTVIQSRTHPNMPSQLSQCSEEGRKITSERSNQNGGPKSGDLLQDSQDLRI